MVQRVLLVDDDQHLVDGLRRALRNESFHVSSVTSAQQAIEFLQTVPINVLVTDEQMPGMSGTDLLKHVRQNYPTTIGIMLTGKADLRTALSAINQGDIYRFFTKPCNDIELSIAIKEALKQRELIAQSRKLIDLMRIQHQYIERLEEETPGISTVTKNESGTIIMEDNLSLDEALDNVVAALNTIEKK